jgi:hypothetical protein
VRSWAKAMRRILLTDAVETHPADVGVRGCDIAVDETLGVGVSESGLERFGDTSELAIHSSLVHTTQGPTFALRAMVGTLARQLREIARDVTLRVEACAKGGLPSVRLRCFAASVDNLRVACQP